MLSLVIVRGLPGSGKSTYARSLSQKGFAHVEADMFFTDKKGVYRFSPRHLKSAHRWCQSMTRQHLEEGRSVVVANTFSTEAEIRPYRALAEQTGAAISVVEMRGNYGSIHNVPPKTVEKMKNRWEVVG